MIKLYKSKSFAIKLNFLGCFFILLNIYNLNELFFLINDLLISPALVVMVSACWSRVFEIKKIF